MICELRVEEVTKKEEELCEEDPLTYLPSWIRRRCFACHGKSIRGPGMSERHQREDFWFLLAFCFLEHGILVFVVQDSPIERS